MSVVRVSWPDARTWFGIIMAGLLSAAGCVHPPASLLLPTPPATRSSPIWSSDAVTEHVRNLSREVDTLASDAKMLPGNDAVDHARIMQRVFADLRNTLPLLGNPVNDRALAQRLITLDEARSRLAAAPSEGNTESIIDEGLRNAAAALADVSRGDNFEQVNIGESLDKLSASLDRLDLERSAIHRVDVADTVDQITAVVSKLATSLSARMTVGPVPASRPAEPESQPAGLQPWGVPGRPRPQSQPAGPESQPTTPPATLPAGTAADGK